MNDSDPNGNSTPQTPVDNTHRRFLAFASCSAAITSFVIKDTLVPNQVEFIAPIGSLVALFGLGYALSGRRRRRRRSTTAPVALATVSLFILIVVQATCVESLEGPEDPGPTPYMIGFMLTDTGKEAAENISSYVHSRVARAGGTARLDDNFGFSLTAVKIVYSVAYLVFLFCSILIVDRSLRIQSKGSP